MLKADITALKNNESNRLAFCMVNDIIENLTLLVIGIISSVASVMRF